MNTIRRDDAISNILNGLRSLGLLEADGHIEVVTERLDSQSQTTIYLTKGQLDEGARRRTETQLQSLLLQSLREHDKSAALRETVSIEWC